MKSGKHADIETIVQPDDLSVYAYAKHLNGMIDNLVDNAVKYSFDNVRIRMSAWRDGNYIVISVRDNGIGISAENQKHIFERFYRVPHGNLHNVKGYCLGLFYVKTMVERHKGKISVKSETDKGSEFTIKIPLK